MDLNSLNGFFTKKKKDKATKKKGKNKLKMYILHDNGFERKYKKEKMNKELNWISSKSGRLKEE